MPTCAYPGCENKAEYTCVVCKQHFCAFHTYQQGGYVCKTHFNEPVFKDPHAPKTSYDWLTGGFGTMLEGDAWQHSALKRWLDRWLGRRRKP